MALKIVWRPGEIEFAQKCIETSVGMEQAFGKFNKKYSDRTLNSIRKKFADVGYAYGQKFMRSKVNPLSIHQEIAKKDEIRDLKDAIALLKTEVRDTKAIEQMIFGLNKHDFRHTPKWLYPKRQRNLTGMVFLMLSDIHHGEVVDPAQVNHVNEFNSKICRERLKYTFQMAVDLPLSRFNRPVFDGIVCSLGGDMISGNIHEELKETNDLTILTSVADITEILIQGVTLLADKYKRVFVPCVVGNHGRLTRKPNHKNKVRDNFEWLVYKYLEKHFMYDDRVTIKVSESSDIQFNIYDIKFLSSHGDQFEGGKGISGIFTPLMLGYARKQIRQQAVNMPFDIMTIHHWHQYIFMEKLIVNGSVKGYDEFAADHNFPFEPPKQSLFIVHPEHGVTYRCPIICNGYEKKSHSQKMIEVFK